MESKKWVKPIPFDMRVIESPTLSSVYLLIANGSNYGASIFRDTKIPQQNISYYLKILIEHGWITGGKYKGKEKIYDVNREKMVEAVKRFLFMMNNSVENMEKVSEEALNQMFEDKIFDKFLFEFMKDVYTTNAGCRLEKQRKRSIIDYLMNNLPEYLGHLKRQKIKLNPKVEQYLRCLDRILGEPIGNMISSSVIETLIHGDI